MNQKGFSLLVVLIVIGVLGLTSFGFYKAINKSTLPKNNSDQSEYQDLSNFEDCVKASGSKIVDTYPRVCISKDQQAYKNAITAIETIKEPIDITNWKVIDELPGFTFKCPPGWGCKRYKDSVVVSTYYSGATTFQFWLVTADNFQESRIRHPSYKTPVAWFNDLKEKKENAIKVLPSTVRSVPGTDGVDSPFYYSFDMSKIKEIVTDSGINGLIVPPGKESVIDTGIFIPVNNENLVVVSLAPDYLIDDPIFKKIIATIDSK